MFVEVAKGVTRCILYMGARFMVVSRAIVETVWRAIREKHKEISE